ncbi:MAG TPA: primosomal protein N' [Chromatiales bacterium]|nr:primosomal protein N' [Chromatiales bacterium]
MAYRPNRVRVAVAAPVHGTFDYLLPDHADGAGCCAPGGRVEVPFGAGQRMGVVVEHSESEECAVETLKSVLRILDDRPALGAAELRLGAWLASYYHAPLGEVLAQMLPSVLRSGGSMDMPAEMGWRLAPEAPSAVSRAPRQNEVLDMLRRAGGMLPDTSLRGHAATLRTLAQRGWIERVPIQDGELPRPAHLPCGKVVLNVGQQVAHEVIRAGLDGFAAFLLHGITGSGKTEVYLAAMDDVLAAGRQVLVLVPEIALTPQLVARFSARLGDGLVVLHSGMTDAARREAWLTAQAGRARVVLGTRSAVFTPMPQLGLIVVDEEHDTSYKQQEGMRYHARDVAVVRASQCCVPVILGSATPSLESLHNAAQGRYRLLRLDERAPGAVLPRLELLDVRRRPMREGLSEPLLERMRSHLAAGDQVLLFLNRRGYAPALTCHACGEVEHCRQCSAPMIVHRARGRLVCHHCGAERALPTRCTACGSTELEMPGQGTERLEDVLQGLFPEFPLERIDRDTTRRKGSLEDKLARARSGEARILLGTQMLAKGHDFPGVTLAAVLDADRGLFSSDFRAPERLVQLIVQVAGRAGRGERRGEVLIQTHHPDHPLLQALLRGGFDACSEALMHERRQARLPPFAHLALLRAEARESERARALLAGVGRWLVEAGAGVVAYGPAPAPLERRAGRFRHQLMLSSPRRDRLHEVLERLLPDLRAWPEARGVRWSLDVDPQDMG